MKTIKRKLFSVFIILMISVIFCGIFLNIMFLKPYYIHKNKNIFLEASKKITKEYKVNKNNLDTYFNEILSSDGISCMITDMNFYMEYGSLNKKQIKIPKEIQIFIIDNEEAVNNKYAYSIVEKEKDSTPMLVFTTIIGKDKLLILSKPLKGITESVSMTNQFYVLAGILMIGIGSLIMVILSNKITKPIIEMSNIAEKISNLNFDDRIAITSTDEIGGLGESINKISVKLNDSMNLLREDIERRKDLVRNISHELKTPIGIIKGYTEGLQYGVADTKDERDQYCQVIVNECNQMDNMVRELLQLSKLESGMFQLNVKEIKLHELIEKVTVIFQHELAKKHIKLIFNCNENTTINGDSELIERVIKNLVTNAINHAEGEKIIEINAERAEDMVKITIFNTGNHIPEKDINNIWDVFSKVDKARSRQYGGHGLGLSIVKQIVVLHNGTVGVENVKDGVMFNLKI